MLAGWTDVLHQSTAEEIQRYREAGRRRQKAYRDRQKGANADSPEGTTTEPHTTREVTHNATRNVTADVGSGSLRDSGEKSAYSRRHVTSDAPQNAPSRFCAKHPSGTTEPCGACARARTALEARESRLTIRGWDCVVDGHKYAADGSCAMCELRPGR